MGGNHLRSQSPDLGAGCFFFQELERSWKEYDRLGAEVTLAKSNLLEQLEALGSPQVMNANRTLASWLEFL